ncbi:hypothetical protein NX862_14370 [Rhodobacter sp. KR11]|uniref:hypothetical protein n=1 Tax=Rhodobacter sp. KR11 TaxID=2974588 RepID=UPI002221790D|nr:hypothetical protein [Rhodobacter sp. KR11]MCW1919942.1 hypothetical protein [Rhodobacter sp. KR11]
MSGAQARFARVPLADGTLVATPVMPDDDLIPGLLAASDVLGTGWYAARVQPGATVAVVGDGAVGLMGRPPTPPLRPSRAAGLSAAFRSVPALVTSAGKPGALLLIAPGPKAQAPDQTLTWVPSSTTRPAGMRK